MSKIHSAILAAQNHNNLLAQQMSNMTALNQPTGKMVLGGGQIMSSGYRATKPTMFFFGNYQNHSGTGTRVQRIDKLLFECFQSCTQTQGVFFNHLQQDRAVEIFGEYNPMYGGAPKDITQMLLRGLAGEIRKTNNLPSSGLFYTVDGIPGVRRVRMRTSYAGIILLEHWAKRFPKFAPFLAPYMTKKNRELIAGECIDLIMGFKPKRFEGDPEKMKLYELKAQNRKMAKELADMKRREQQRIMDEQLRQQQYNQHLYPPTIYTGTSAGTAPLPPQPTTAISTSKSISSALGLGSLFGRK